MSTDKKNQILKSYCTIAKKLGRDVKMSDLKELGLTKDMISHHYGSLSALEQEARLVSPESFFDVAIESIYSPKSLASLREEVSKHKRFVITTAVAGCKVHEGFYSSIKNYCAINNATLLVLVAADPASTSGAKSWGKIDAKLQDEAVVIEDTKLNNNLFLSTIKLSAKHIDPITGLGRIGQRNGTFIYASPKQRLKAVAVGNNKLPHFMMTTGAITTANYNTESYMSQRTAYIADNDHVMGALVIEVEDEEIFHFRQIQCDPHGSFPDLGVMYSEKSTKAFLPEAFILGDWHSGSTDPEARACWMEVCKELRPKSIFLHDLLDGRSISHHEEHDIILRSQHASKGHLSLESELKLVAEDMESLLEVVDNLVVVKSNHDIFLERYLREGKYVKDPTNHKLSLQLALKLLDKQDPLKVGVDMFMDEQSAAKVNWLSMDEDYKIAGVQLGAHGHAGANGSRGSLQNLEESYGRCIVGHSHTPQILRGAWQVGTSSFLKMSYVKGASSWVHTSCLIYANGARQMINCIDGKWRLKD
jgi:hypothetical protein